MERDIDFNFRTAETLRQELDRLNDKLVDIRHEIPDYWAWRRAAADAKTYTHLGSLTPARTMIALANV